MQFNVTSKTIDFSKNRVKIEFSEDVEEIEFSVILTYSCLKLSARRY